MVPRYANPYLLPQYSQIVSRAALLNSDDELDRPDVASDERAEKLARLETLLRQTIVDVDTNQASAGKYSDDNPRKRKRRRKEGATEATEPQQLAEDPRARSVFLVISFFIF